MTKIIYTSAEDFVRQEIDEHGFEYVDRQFDLGFEPGLVNALGQSFYTWVKVNDVLPLQLLETNSLHNHNAVSSVYNHSVSVVSRLS